MAVDTSESRRVTRTRHVRHRTALARARQLGVQLVGTNGDAVTSALVSAGPNGIDRKGAKFAMRLPTSEDVEAVLRAL